MVLSDFQINLLDILYSIKQANQYFNSHSILVKIIFTYDKLHKYYSIGLLKIIEFIFSKKLILLSNKKYYNLMILRL